MKGGNCFFNPYRVIKVNCKNGISERMTVEDYIISIVASVCDISIVGMKSESRMITNVTEARFIAMYIMWKFYQPITKVGIGKIFKRNHTSIMYALKKAQDWYDTDKRFRSKMDECIAEVSKVIPRYEAA